jgi:hypothetical protein
VETGRWATTHLVRGVTELSFALVVQKCKKQVYTAESANRLHCGGLFEVTPINLSLVL